jgi:acetyl-CoA synthetase
MPWEIIKKTDAERQSAALPDPEAARRDFHWETASEMLDGLPGGGINIAHEALDRHVAAGHGGQVAIRWLGQGDTRRDLTYAGLAEDAARFANVLTNHGLGRGDRLLH